MTKQAFQPLIVLLFFLSGATGLIYQIVWFKYLSLFLGNTTYAQTIVVATFMAGLAIGAALLGKRADAVTNQFRLYGMLEAGIAVYCLFYPFIYFFLRDQFVALSLFFPLEVGSPSLLILKLIISVLSLLLPAILMGGTLPVLAKGLTHRISESGKKIALLYALNSAGAVLGAVLCGFFFVRLFGLQATIIGTSLFNLLLALAALYLSAKVQVAHPADAIADERPLYSVTAAQVRIALIVAGLSGAASMIYETTWVRMLVLVFGSSTYSFSLILVAFITGIALGSFIVERKIALFKDPVVALAWCQIGIAIILLDTLPLYGGIPYLFWKIGMLLPRTDEMYVLFLITQYAFILLIMLAPTTLLGMSLPLAASIVTSARGTIGSTTGRIFSINTIGAVAGSFAAGFLLIPFLGIRHTMEIGIGISAACSLAVWSVSPIESHKKVNALIVLLVCGIGYSLFVSDWTRLMTYSGVPRALSSKVNVPESFGEFSKKPYYHKEEYYKEGSTATVSVVKGVVMGVMQDILLINGKPDASSYSDLPTQAMLAQLPMLFHEKPESVLVIGYGSGVTAGSVLTHDVMQLDIVEISPEVIEASKFFEKVSNAPLKDTRVRLYTDDALVHLQLTRTPYDVIISEPSNPWMAGVGNLFSKDFFELCKSRLNAGGLMVQWFHLYEMDDETLTLVLRTFQSVFPHVSIWHPVEDDIIIIGGDHPLDPDMQRAVERFSVPAVRKDFERLLITDFSIILSLQSMSSDRVKKYCGEGELNTEDRPLLEYNAPRAFFADMEVRTFKERDARLSRITDDLLLSRYYREKDLPDNTKWMLAFYHADAVRGNMLYSYKLLLELNKKYPKDNDIKEAMAAVIRTLGDRKRNSEVFSEHTEQ